VIQHDALSALTAALSATGTGTGKYSNCNGPEHPRGFKNPLRRAHNQRHAQPAEYPSECEMVLAFE